MREPAMNPTTIAGDCYVDSPSHEYGLFHDCFECGRVTCSLHAEWWQQLWLCRPCYEKRGLQIRLEFLRDVADFQIQDMLHADGTPAGLAILKDLEQIDERLCTLFHNSLLKDFADNEDLLQWVRKMEKTLERSERSEQPVGS